MKLGKAPARRDDRTLSLRRYTALMPLPPDQAGVTSIPGLGMMLNDSLGDCTCAAIGHLIQTWTYVNKNPVVLSDADILALYEKACGYNPSDSTTDNGGVELDVLNYWRNNPVVGHSLTAYVGISVARANEIRDAVWFFGGAYAGVQLPISAQTQEVWDVSKGRNGEVGSWGGHAVPIVGYDKNFLYCITWGAVKKMTWAFYQKYFDEAYALISPDWTSAGTSPQGFNTVQLIADLQYITSA